VCSPSTTSACRSTGWASSRRSRPRPPRSSTPSTTGVRRPHAPHLLGKPVLPPVRPRR
jgi:hypothetical protein